MALLCVWMLKSMLGTVVDIIHMSTKDRLKRKKYIGVCRWESDMVARMISRLPNTVVRYMDRNSPYMRG
jgi:hypothetical protein